jgi:hypothetical protein
MIRRRLRRLRGVEIRQPSRGGQDAVSDDKTDETRRRRIAKQVEALSEGRVR